MINFRNEISGVMSVPRLGFSANHKCLNILCANTGILFYEAEGVYWGQVMNKALSDSVDKTPYILTCDYDSGFCVNDVIQLYKIMESRPDIGALAAFQMQRVLERAICGYRTEDTTDGYIPIEIMESDTFEVNYAHFGLTLFRSELFKTLPKPWFNAYAGADGDWGNDRVDEDIHFWRNWREAGNTVHIANKIVIGHMELMMVFPDQMMNKIYMQPRDYFESGKPSNAWPLKCEDDDNA